MRRGIDAHIARYLDAASPRPTLAKGGLPVEL